MDAFPNGYPWNIAGYSVKRSGSLWGNAQISVAGRSRGRGEVRPAASRNTKSYQADHRYENRTSKTNSCDGQPA